MYIYVYLWISMDFYGFLRILDRFFGLLIILLGGWAGHPHPKHDGLRQLRDDESKQYEWENKNMATKPPSRSLL